jgi:GTP-binding protein
MMEEYFSKNDKVKLVVFLLDSRRVINEEDRELIDFIEECNIPYIIVMTKCDKLNQKETALMKKNIKEAFIDIDQSNILLSSIKNNKMLQNIRDAIIKYLQ